MAVADERPAGAGRLLRDGTALAAGGAALAAWPLASRSAPSAEQDTAILKFALLLEDLQAAFYADALLGGALHGELLQFAETVGEHEPNLIPGRISHGCIRLRNADILRLARLLPVGTPLTIV